MINATLKLTQVCTKCDGDGRIQTVSYAHYLEILPKSEYLTFEDFCKTHYSDGPFETHKVCSLCRGERFNEKVVSLEELRELLFPKFQRNDVVTMELSDSYGVFAPGHVFTGRFVEIDGKYAIVEDHKGNKVKGLAKTLRHVTNEVLEHNDIDDIKKKILSVVVENQYSAHQKVKYIYDLFENRVYEVLAVKNGLREVMGVTNVYLDQNDDAWIVTPMGFKRKQ